MTAEPASRLAAHGGDEQRSRGWRTRVARAGDAEPIASAVRRLLIELGAEPPRHELMCETARILTRDPRLGVILLAERPDCELVGLLGANWPTAIHAGGRYALIQDLWVHPRWRGRTVGADLLQGLREVAARRRIARIEVGLPRAGFATIERTRRFYLKNGFEPIGGRMRANVG